MQSQKRKKSNIQKAKIVLLHYTTCMGTVLQCNHVQSCMYMYTYQFCVLVRVRSRTGSSANTLRRSCENCSSSKSVSVCIHPSNPSKRKQRDMRVKVQGVREEHTCRLRMRCFPFQYFNIWSSCSVLTTSLAWIDVSTLKSSNKHNIP